MTNHDCLNCRSLEDLIEDVWRHVFGSDYPGAVIAMASFRYILGTAIRNVNEPARTKTNTMIALSVHTAHELLSRTLTDSALISKLFESGRYSGGNAVAMLDVLCFALGHPAPQIQQLLKDMEAALASAHADTVQ